MYFVIGLVAALTLAACGSGSSSSNDSSPTTTAIQPTNQTTDQLIKLNQLGFATNSTKVAIVPSLSDRDFSLISTADETEVFSAPLTPLSYWQPSDESVSIADFSAFNTAGEYQIKIDGIATSAAFVIRDNVFEALHDATIKAFYYNRSSTSLLEIHAGAYARAMGHADSAVKIHVSAASVSRPVDTIITASRGWYDAGDFGKYVVTAAIASYTLMTAYEHFPSFYTSKEFNIPESGDTVPDILNEIKWSLDWLETMQDPNDGGVYHKLTTLEFAGGAVMPEDNAAQRYLIQKGTAATLSFSAVMAVASRIYQNFDTEFPGKALAYRQASIAAWNWAQANNNTPYVQPEDVYTGAYEDDVFDDELSWAAAELYILTQENTYLDRFKQLNLSVLVEPTYRETAALGYLSLMAGGQSLLTQDDHNNAITQVITRADYFVDMHQQSAYGTALNQYDFYWGSNGGAMNKAMLLMQAFRITDQQKYKNAALGLLDYILGRNPTDYSFVTGFGNKSPQNIHHSQSEADQILAPIPGFLVGGANYGREDNCNYPSLLSAKAYLDDFCSYASNEVTIYWNAPLVYVLAAMQTL